MIVLFCPLICSSSRPLSKPLGTVPSVPITINITVTLIIGPFCSWVSLLLLLLWVFTLLLLLYYYYYYNNTFWVFHTSMSWWSFTEVWATASLLRSPGLFSVFWPILEMLKFWESQFVLQFWELFWATNFNWYHHYFHVPLLSLFVLLASLFFFTPVLTYDLSMKYEWQQISSDLQNSSESDLKTAAIWRVSIQSSIPSIFYPILWGTFQAH